jgi:hypothetical protein
MLAVGQVAPHDDQVHGLFVLLVKLAHLLPGLIQDANPERFFPSDLEHRRLGFERVSPAETDNPPGESCAAVRPRCPSCCALMLANPPIYSENLSQPGLLCHIAIPVTTPSVNSAIRTTHSRAETSPSRNISEASSRTRGARTDLSSPPRPTPGMLERPLERGRRYDTECPPASLGKTTVFTPRRRS